MSRSVVGLSDFWSLLFSSFFSPASGRAGLLFHVGCLFFVELARFRAVARIVVAKS